ncbi:lactate utilization protein [soil metagenome]
MSSRDAILGKIRKSLGVTGEEPGRNANVDQRLRAAPRGVIPARGQLPPAERLDLFEAMAKKFSASVARVPRTDDVPAAIADYLRQHNLPAAVRTGDDPRLAALPWSRTQVAVTRGRSYGDDPVSVSHALTGVAETGTLLLTSGANNPTTLNFLPETHIVVIDAADVVGDYETAFDRLRARDGKGVMPRAVNMITGPSRSGDIEQTIILGAHGPRSVHIVIVGEP